MIPSLFTGADRAPDRRASRARAGWATPPGRRGHRGAVLPKGRASLGPARRPQRPLSSPRDESQESRPGPKSETPPVQGDGRRGQRGHRAAPRSHPGLLLWPHLRLLGLGWHSGETGSGRWPCLLLSISGPVAGCEWEGHLHFLPGALM